MPVEVGVWRVSGEQVDKVNFSSIESERRLEEILIKDLTVLSEDLILIGSQVLTDYGKFIDLLAMDAEGDLHILELKRNRTPRDVVAQTLDYASWVEGLTFEQVIELFEQKNEGARLEEAFESKFNEPLPETLNTSHQMTIVASYLDVETERIIGYLSSHYNVPINAVFFRYFESEGNEYITRSWLIDPNTVEDKAEYTANEKKKEKWNKQDFVVNFLNDVPNRSWEDARTYGFVSAGGNRRYYSTLGRLFVGARVFAYMPGAGYMGVGTVTETVKPLKDVTFYIDGEECSIWDLDLQAKEITYGADDPDECEYIVKIDWTATVPVEKAYKEKGLKANQNIAFKLNSQFTIDKVTKFFNL
ncbi:DUF91 domain-containing protein [Shouchella sp. 1P09AA]|uniref:DUF91 domain-containing protein n=1 Tax=unclassified Shouchella TaxID=2893065 RepID=UPI0039A3920C